jgi:hypothetical protein
VDSRKSGGTVVVNIVLIIVLPTIIVAVATILLARRRAGVEEFDTDSMGFIGGVLNALFVVILAFYIVFAWQNGDTANSQATAEAAAMVNTYWEIGDAPDPVKSQVRDQLREYAHEVIDHEWSDLDQARPDPRVDDLLKQIRTEVSALPTDPDSVKEAHSSALSDIQTIDLNHGDRVDAATDANTFTLFLLIGTIIGAVLMLAFPLILGLSAKPSNILAMVLMTLTLGAIIFISFQLLHPLHGFFGVTPDAFHDALDEIGG